MIFLFLLMHGAAASTPETSLIAEGEYLTRAASCRECHTPPGAPDFSGGVPIVTPFGIFITPNISPDPETGIGAWTLAQFHRALRDGVSPQHKIYYPSFPYRSYSKMTDADIEKIFAYLRVQPPVRREDRPHELNWIFDQRWLLWFWQNLFFQSPSRDREENVKIAHGPFETVPERSAEWNRGAYLTEAVLHCAECHSPRNALGAPESSRWMAGSDILFGGKTPPNLTPDPDTGTTWTREQWLTFLSSGVDPGGRSPGGEMALAVRAASGLSLSDRQAVVEYLLSLKPVRRYSQVRAP